MIKSFFNEFKKFAMRGNVMDMAVGIIIGAAFGKIVDSMVKDIMMPPIGLLLGKVDFSDLKWKIADDVSINYGVFLNNVISFIIVAFAVFVLIKAVNKLQEKMIKEEEKAQQKNAAGWCLRRFLRFTQRGRTLTALSLPAFLGSFSTSNSTFWPSSRVLKPSTRMAEKWTKTSSPPSSQARKPKPFVALNHLTVPVFIRHISLFLCAGGTDLRIETQKTHISS